LRSREPNPILAASKGRSHRRVTVGLDDETNQIRKSLNSTVKPNSVSKTAEIVLEITPAGDKWKGTVIEQGVTAWTTNPPAYTSPPSQGYSHHQQKEEEEEERHCVSGYARSCACAGGTSEPGKHNFASLESGATRWDASCSSTPLQAPQD
jgi:hypothetical protein